MSPPRPRRTATQHEASPSRSRQQIRDRFVQSYRRRRLPSEGPRPDLLDRGFGEVWEDNAPEWVTKLVDMLVKRIGANRDVAKVEELLHGLACWCDEGDPDARCAQVLALADNWVGPRMNMLTTFLAQAIQHGGGKKRDESTFEWQMVDVDSDVGEAAQHAGFETWRTRHGGWKIPVWLYYAQMGRRPSDVMEKVIRYEHKALKAAYRAGGEEAVCALMETWGA